MLCNTYKRRKLNMKQTNVHKLAVCAMIAAFYAAVSLSLDRKSVV